MYWVFSTKKYQIFKCTGFPEHEMCVYGEGINFENRKNLVFDIGLKTAVIFGQIIFKK